MSGYKSPITIEDNLLDRLTEALVNNLSSTIDDQICATVRFELGVDIDKEELVKALKYDRDQYEKGYEDGIRDATNHMKHTEHVSNQQT